MIEWIAAAMGLHGIGLSISKLVFAGAETEIGLASISKVGGTSDENFFALADLVKSWLCGGEERLVGGD